jgi:hypothetical protein
MAVAAVLQRDHYRFPGQPAVSPGSPARRRCRPRSNARPAPSAPPSAAVDESDQVFDSAAELFRLLSTPIRLKIISALCGHEKNVSQLLPRSTPRSPT